MKWCTDIPGPHGMNRDDYGDYLTEVITFIVRDINGPQTVHPRL